MTGGLLADSGFFIAMYEPRDVNHAAAQGKREWLDLMPIVLPWPILYETLNTRFARRPAVMARLDAVVMHPDTQLLDDSSYRQDAYRSAMAMGRRGRPLSLVDAVLRAVIDDTNVALDAVLTFNLADFVDVCRHNSVEVL